MCVNMLSEIKAIFFEIHYLEWNKIFKNFLIHVSTKGREEGKFEEGVNEVHVSKYSRHI